MRSVLTMALWYSLLQRRTRLSWSRTTEQGEKMAASLTMGKITIQIRAVYFFKILPWKSDVTSMTTSKSWHFGNNITMVFTSILEMIRITDICFFVIFGLWAWSCPWNRWSECTKCVLFRGIKCSARRYCGEAVTRTTLVRDGIWLG